MITIKLHTRLVLGILLLAALTASLSCSSVPKVDGEQHTKSPQPIPIYTYTILNTYIHDNDAYTQGLALENGVLYEGTGLYGESSLRKVELETGSVLQIHRLPSAYFGEGITILGDTIIQLTWRSNRGFIYDRASFEILQEFTYTTEGWGITHDGKRLIMSDGTSILYFLDPNTFTVTGHVQVYEDNLPVINLNELEYVRGYVYANAWPTDNVAIIDPDSGHVVGWIDLSGLFSPQTDGVSGNVLNGIAYDTKNDRLFVTGKLWSTLFEIQLVLKD